MKTLALKLAACASLWLAVAVRGGEISDLYYKMPHTNSIKVEDLIGPPRGPARDHGISEFGIERSGCFGTCPVYTCIIRSDGTVRYKGIAHVNKIGDWEAKLDPYRFHRIADFIMQAGYLALSDEFTSGITCSDTVYTMIRRNGRYKIISNYASSGPSKLWVLQELMDQLVEKCAWHQVTRKGKPSP